MKSISRLVLVCTYELVMCSSGASTLFSAGTLDIDQGASGIVSLSLSGNTLPFAGVNAKIVLPQGITCAGVTLGSIASGFTLDYESISQETSNAVTVFAYNHRGSTSSANGEVLRLTLRASANAPVGTHPLSFAEVPAMVGVNSIHGLALSSGVTLLHTTQDGSVTILAGSEGEGEGEGEDCATPGDVNGDGTPSPGDAQSAFEHYLGIATLPSIECADLCPQPDGDGAVTPGDAQGIFNLYLQLPACAGKQGREKNATVLAVGSKDALPLEAVDIPVHISGAAGLESFGLQLAYDPALLRYVGVTPGLATADWATIAGKETTPGLVMLGGFMGVGTPLQDEGEVAVLSFVSVGGPGEVLLQPLNLADSLSTAILVPGKITCLTNGEPDGEGEPEGDGLRIVRQPLGGLAEVGEDHTFQIEAVGNRSAVHYQWLKDGEVLTDSPDTPSLTLPFLDYTDSGAYSCRVMDSEETVVSETAVLNVVAQVPAAGLTALGIVSVLIALAAFMKVLRGRTNRSA